MKLEKKIKDSRLIENPWMKLWQVMHEIQWLQLKSIGQSSV